MLTKTKIFRRARSKSFSHISPHFMGTLKMSGDNRLIYQEEKCKEFVFELLKDKGIKSLGHVTHKFPNDSFTLLVSLAESHISVHTWPERKSIQIDVFLCNYERDNSRTGKEIYESLLSYFKPVGVDTSVVMRP